MIQIYQLECWKDGRHELHHRLGRVVVIVGDRHEARYCLGSSTLASHLGTLAPGRPYPRARGLHTCPFFPFCVSAMTLEQVGMLTLGASGTTLPCFSVVVRARLLEMTGSTLWPRCFTKRSHCGRPNLVMTPRCTARAPATNKSDNYFSQPVLFLAKSTR